MLVSNPWFITGLCLLAVGCNTYPAAQTVVHVHAVEGVLPNGAADLTIEVFVGDVMTSQRGPISVSRDGSLLARVPVVPAEGDVSRRFELVATLSNRGEGLAPMVIRVGGGYADREAREIHATFYAECADTEDCGAGRTCTPQGCVGSCSALGAPGEGAVDAVPSCGRCQRCDANQCLPLPDFTACRCDGLDNLCAAGACVGCEGEVTTETVVFLHVPSEVAPTATRLRLTASDVGETQWAWDYSVERAEPLVERVQLVPSLPTAAESFELLAELLDGDVVVLEQRIAGVHVVGESRAVHVGFTTECEGVAGDAGCGPGRTCLRGACVASCYDGGPLDPGASETRPRCGECAECVEGACVDRANGSTCGCATDGCRNGACVPVTSALGVDVGAGHACVHRRTGAPFCWGRSHAQRIPDDTPTPTSIALPGTGDGVTQDVAVANDQTCAIHLGGTGRLRRFCWGFNLGQRLAVGATDGIVSSPVEALGDPASLRDIDGGLNSFCGLSEDRRIFCFGVVMGGGGTQDTATQLVFDPTGGYPEAGWSRLSVEWQHACALHEDGRAICWGVNDQGQLGDSSPAIEPRWVRDPATSEILDGFTEIAVSHDRTCAIRAGEIWCWGLALTGGGAAMILEPSRIDARNDWVRLDMGSGASLCAINALDELWCRGRNPSGQLGVGDRAFRAEFERVALTADQHFVLVRMGLKSTCAIDTHGALYCWGDDGANAPGMPPEPGLLGLGPLPPDTVIPEPRRVCF